MPSAHTMAVAYGRAAVFANQRLHAAWCDGGIDDDGVRTGDWRDRAEAAAEQSERLHALAETDELAAWQRHLEDRAAVAEASI